MLDLSRFARTLGFVFLGYMVGWPVLLIAGGIAVYGFHATSFDTVSSWWTWPVPCIFPFLSALLTVDFFRRLRDRRLTRSQVGSYRFEAFLFVVGAAFALARHWEPVAIGAVLAVPMFFPAKKRAAATTGER